MADRNLAFKALSDPTRRDVFERLAGGAKAVGELADELPVSRPAVSQHLKVLKEAGLVIDRAEGTRRVYQIDPAGLGTIRAWLDRFWDDALAAFKAKIERTAQPPEPPARGTGKHPSKSRDGKSRSDR
jgi:DNA-binding transcriptional ArsR family regulator